jgi:uncharacterized RDD family membrane protein YckC
MHKREGEPVVARASYDRAAAINPPDIGGPVRSPFASPRQRLLAWLVDAAIFWTPVTIAISVVATGGNARSQIIGFLIFLPAIAVIPSFYALFEGSSRGQTPGKMLLRIAVRDSRDFGRVTYARAFLREYSRAVFWLLVYLPAVVDALWALRAARSQTVHDLLARTVVVSVGPVKARPGRFEVDPL